MSITAAICWHDEPIEHLERVVDSVAGVVDAIVAYEGRWELFPQRADLQSQASRMRLILAERGFTASRGRVVATCATWESQAAKRTALYRNAVQGAEWVLVIDADEEIICDCPSSFREHLARIERAKSPDAVNIRVATPGPRESGGGDTATAPHGVRYQPRLLRARPSLVVGPHSHRTLTTDECVIQAENECDRALHVNRRAARIATIHGASIVNRTHSRSAERIAAKQAYGKARAERGID